MRVGLQSPALSCFSDPDEAVAESIGRTFPGDVSSTLVACPRTFSAVRWSASPKRLSTQRRIESGASTTSTPSSSRAGFRGSIQTWNVESLTADLRSLRIRFQVFSSSLSVAPVVDLGPERPQITAGRERSQGHSPSLMRLAHLSAFSSRAAGAPVQQGSSDGAPDAGGSGVVDSVAR